MSILKWIGWAGLISIEGTMKTLSKKIKQNLFTYPVTLFISKLSPVEGII